MLRGELLPPIKIHMFSDSPDGDQLMQRALLDRRLAKATARVYSGGIRGAVAIYQTQPTPNIIIIECLQNPIDILAMLNELSLVCDTSTQLLLIGKINDVDFYRKLMKRGVNDYILTPQFPADLIRSIWEVYIRGGGRFSARTIAVIGARGGVGSSIVAQNLSYALSRHVQTVLVDLDMPYGTAALNFNQDPTEGMAAALAEPDRLDNILLDRIMVSCSERLRLLAAPAMPSDDYCVDPAYYNEVIHRVKATAAAVVLDIPKQWTPWISHALVEADEVMLVAGPDLVSLRNTKNIVDALREMRPTDSPVRLIINQAGLPGRREIPSALFSKAVALAPDARLDFDARLFDDATSQGQMAVVVSPDSRFAASMERLAVLVGATQLRTEPKAPKKMSKIVQWMRVR